MREVLFQKDKPRVRFNVETVSHQLTRSKRPGTCYEHVTRGCVRAWNLWDQGTALIRRITYSYLSLVSWGQVTTTNKTCIQGEKMSVESWEAKMSVRGFQWNFYRPTHRVLQFEDRFLVIHCVDLNIVSPVSRLKSWIWNPFLEMTSASCFSSIHVTGQQSPVMTSHGFEPKRRFD